MDLNIEKDKTVLTHANYQDRQSILTTFRFKPCLSESSIERLNQASKKHISIEGKDLYVLDGFFLDLEGDEMRLVCKNLDFEVPVCAKTENIGKFAFKSRSMNNRGRWQLFSQPPNPFREFYQLLGTLACHLDIEIALHPWFLRGEVSSLPAFVVNYHEGMSAEDEYGDKHCDYEPEKGVCFGIPNLYSKEKELHKSNFVNGAVGKPLLVTAMLYSTSHEYDPKYGMGTAFYENGGKKVFSSDCIDMRLVLFEGDILHGVEKSDIPEGLDVWRISYVFKLTMNPSHSSQDIKAELKKLILKHTEINSKTNF